MLSGARVLRLLSPFGPAQGAAGGRRAPPVVHARSASDTDDTPEPRSESFHARLRRFADGARARRDRSRSVHTISTNIAIEAKVSRFDGPYRHASRDGNGAAQRAIHREFARIRLFLCGRRAEERVFSRGACDNARRPKQGGTFRRRLLRVEGSNRMIHHLGRSSRRRDRHTPRSFEREACSRSCTHSALRRASPLGSHQRKRRRFP